MGFVVAFAFATALDVAVVIAVARGDAFVERSGTGASPRAAARRR